MGRSCLVLLVSAVNMSNFFEMIPDEPELQPAIKTKKLDSDGIEVLSFLSESQY